MKRRRIKRTIAEGYIGTANRLHKICKMVQLKMREDHQKSGLVRRRVKRGQLEYTRSASS